VLSMRAARPQRATSPTPVGSTPASTYNSTLTERRWLCRPSAAHRTHHPHLVADRDELERHLRFHDAVQANTNLALCDP
jgi:GrpB-like predicted nucleotidyltransferase (UPF0157 family)